MLIRRLSSLSLLSLVSLMTVALVSACGDDVAPGNGVASVDAGKKTKAPKGDDDDDDDDDVPPGDDDDDDDAGTLTDAATDATVDSSAPGPVDGGTGCVAAGDCALTIDPAAGKTVEAVFGQGTALLDRPRQPQGGKDYDTCYVNPFPAPVNTYYAYVEVKNPSASAAKVEVRLDTPAGGSFAASLLAAYPKIPTTTAERNACLTGVNMKCPVSTGLTEPKWPCLIGEGTPTIPANGSIWIYVGLNSPPTQTAGKTPARFVVRATTK